eukprot:CAMPEP_0196593000 /NCGR_PEP_ID=MMETSP1081-20130531/74361_1 /TAXON_ID=36882 /ORGANISM="Pyramimonas amylifera, Strain CCMP720" /LENGTH=144 /DNA_ID=CAMNT_0041916837 /DNA_START=520 /DNA_END=954 /DNA_ORIENTATION=+
MTVNESVKNSGSPYIIYDNILEGITSMPQDQVARKAQTEPSLLVASKSYDKESKMIVSVETFRDPSSTTYGRFDDWFEKTYGKINDKGIAFHPRQTLDLAVDVYYGSLKKNASKSDEEFLRVKPSKTCTDSEDRIFSSWLLHLL